MKNLIVILALVNSLVFQNLAFSSEPYFGDEPDMRYASLKEIESKINSGADIDSVSILGNSQVSYVALFRSKERLKGWIELGANINKVNRDGSTPLFWAIFGSRTNNVELLINSGAKLDQKNKHGDSPLHLAINGIGEYSPQITILLVKAGSDVNLLDLEGNSPLNLLRKRKKYGYWGTIEEEIERLLISKGAIDVSTFSHVSSAEKSIRESGSDRSASQKSNNQSVREDDSTCDNGWQKARKRSSGSQASSDNCKAEENSNPIH